MKKLFTMLLLAAVSMATMAEKELYAVYDGNTMNIYYSAYREADSGVTEWWHVFSSAKEVVFDVSVADAEPTSTFMWFYKFYNLTTIKGLAYLNTEKVTDMSEMFMGCSSLAELDLSTLNTSNVTNMSKMFARCESLTELDLRNFNTSKVTDMSYMFEDCSKLEKIYCKDNWGASATLTNSENMFDGCENLQGGDATNPTGYNAEKVDKQYARPDNPSAGQPGYFSTTLGKQLYAVYEGTTLTIYYDADCESKGGLLKWWQASFNLEKDPSDLVTNVIFDASVTAARPKSTSKWFVNFRSLTDIDNLDYLNTSEVTDMSEMFAGCTNLKSLDLSHFNTSKVKDMRGLFSGCAVITSLDLSSFNTSNVTSMFCMFNCCYKLISVDLSSFNTAKVVDMEQMFYNCGALKSLDLSSFNTSKVTTMSQMFDCCNSLTSLDVSSFNTSEVTWMAYMFEGCKLLTSLDLRSFNTSKVKNMAYMFNHCELLTELDLNSFDISNVMSTNYMFSGCYELQTIYCSQNWSASSTLTSSKDMFRDCTKLKGGDSKKPTVYDSSKIDKTYARPDNSSGGKPGYFSRPDELYGVLTATSSGSALYIYYDGNRESNGGVLDWWNDEEISSVVKKVNFTENVANARPTSTAKWFSNFTKLTTIQNLSSLNTSEVTAMDSMFYLCISLTELDLSNFNTSKVKDMSSMFESCSKLTSLDVSTFNTSNVTNMRSMFASCGTTSLDLSNFNTSKVTDMSGMFNFCYTLTSLDVSSFNTSEVTDMSYMFFWCKNLTSLDLSNFKTGKVINMNDMFYNCQGLTSLDLTGFNTNMVEDMSRMFNNCSNLETIYCNKNWGASETLYFSTAMFKGCTKLKGGDATNPTEYDADKTDAEYARPDEPAVGKPGYFTKTKESELYGALNGTTLTIYYDTNRESNSGVLEWWKDATIPSTTEKVVFDESVADASPTNTSGWFSNFQKLTDIIDLSYLHTSEVTDMSGMFGGCSSLTSLDLSSFNTGKVTNMRYMFGGCSFLSSLDLSGFNTSNVTDMSSMFYDCGSLTSLNVSSFNTSKVTEIKNMFTRCQSLKSLDLSNFNTSNITDMTALFQDCRSLISLDLSSFNTSKVTAMSSMFNNCQSLTSVNLSSFNTSEVEKMNNMFWYCAALTSLDLSSFNTSKVTDMSSMFGWCKSLTSLDVSEFDISNVTNMSSMFENCSNLQTIYCNDDWSASATLNFSYDMFSGCAKLKGGNPANPTIYNSEKVNKEYAHPDGLNGKPGYFTFSELPTYKVQLIAENGAITSDPVVADLAHVTFGTALVLTATPAEGYDFDKWTNYDGVKLVVTSDTTVTASFKIKTFTVIFQDEDGTELKKETVEYGKSATAPKEPAKDGKTFIKWDTDFSKVTSDLTVKAVYDIKEYTVTFVGQDDKVLKTETVEHGKSATAPEAPAVEGYHFTGWDKAFDKVTKDITVKAQYAINEYTVTFVGQDDKVLKTEKVEHGKSATAPEAPEVEGYHFTGWDKTFDNVTSDLTVKAQYAINEYTVTFVGQDDKVLKNEIVEHGKSATAPEAPEVEGYHFTGWDADYSNVTEDLTIKALYAINEYTVTFVGQDDKVLKTETVEHGKSATAPEAPEVEGYEFKGWDVDFSEVKSDLTVHAIYEEIVVIDYTPQNLKVVLEEKDDDMQITLSWDKVEGAASYDVKLLNGEEELGARNTAGLNVITRLLSEIGAEYKLNPGTYTINWSVRSTNANGEAISDWANGDSFEVTIKNPTGVENVENTGTQPSPVAVKVIIDGKLYILRDGKTYTVQGQEVK